MPRYRFSPEQEAEITRRFIAGETVAALAQEFDSNVWTIRKVAFRNGAEKRSWGGQGRKFTDEQIAQMIEWAQQGLSQNEIATRLDSKQVTISRVLRQHGHDAWNGLRSGSNHGSWKGGRVVTEQGYIRVLLPRDHPLASMRDYTGYVLEHRLIMAEHLGRPLKSSEHVHHINGDRADNRLENLQLRQRHHGAGVVYRCKDCGSYNVEPAEIDDK